MATGVTPKDKNRADYRRIHISYDGKSGISEVLNHKYSNFSCSHHINGGGDNKLFYGDNLDALLYLLNHNYRGEITLIYIDPPFATKSDFLSRNQDHAYSDIVYGGEYVEFLRERLIIMRELLSETGSIYLHLDGNMAFVMKLIMDEVFGEKNCHAFITRKKCSTKNYTRNTYGNISDYILFYSKNSSYIWNRPCEQWEVDRLIKEYPCVDVKTGRRYKKVPLHAPGIRNGKTGEAWRGMLPPKGKHWQFTPEKLDELDEKGEIYWSSTNNPRRKVFCDFDKGVPIQDIWLDYRDNVNQSQRTTGYPTEKNYEMLKMIINASSNYGDTVMDCFAGSGTTLGAASELGRKWIGMDNSAESIRAIYKRLVEGLDVYGDYVGNKGESMKLLDDTPDCSFDLFVADEPTPL